MIVLPPYYFPAEHKDEPTQKGKEDLYTRFKNLEKKRREMARVDRYEFARNRTSDLHKSYNILAMEYGYQVRYPASFLPMENLSVHRGRLYLTYRDPGRPRVRVELTLEGFEKYLKRHGIPFQKDAADAFLKGVRELLQDRAMTDSERLIRQLIQNGRTMAADAALWLKFATNYYDGHLILTVAVQDFGGQLKSRCIVESLFHASRESIGFTVPEFRALLTALKSEGREHARMNYKALQPLRSLDAFDLLYYNEAMSCGVYFDKEKQELRALSYAVTYPHTQKRVPLKFRVSLGNYPENFLHPLYVFTGGEPSAVDGIAKLLAAIAAPTPKKKQLSVVFTKANKVSLSRFLLQAVEHCVRKQTQDQKEEYRLPVSQVLKAERLKVLISDQVDGNFCILCDGLPTPSQESNYRKLIQGGRVVVKDAYVTSLSFHNQMHLVYITDDEKLANTLVQQYGAELVDLSPWEKPWTGDLALSRPEIQWIQHSLILHGCACRHGLAGAKPPKKKARKAPVISVDQDIQDFLDHQCRYGKTLQCSHIELYEAYVEYCIRCKDEPPEIERIQFGKEVRKVLPSSVVKKVARHGPENKPITCYVGLGIRKKAYTPPETAPAQDEPSEDELTAFRSYLEEMEKLAEKVLPLPHDAKPQIIGRGFSRYEGQSAEDVSRELISQDTPEAGNAE